MNRIPPVVRWIGGALLLVLLGYVLWRIRSVLGTLAAGFIIAYSIEPTVSRLERWHVPRALGAFVLAALIVTVIVFVVVFAVPVISAEVSQFAQSVSLAKAFDPAAWPPGLRDYVARHQDDIAAYQATATAWVRANAGRLLSSVAAFTGRLFSSVAGFIVSLLNIVVIPIFAFYLVVDYAGIKSGAASLVPEPARPEAYRLGREIDAVLRAFLRGQFFVAVALGVMYAVGLTALGTPLGILIGLAAGLLNMVPYLGLAAGLLPALLLNFLEHQSWSRLLGVLLVFVVAQNVEGWILTPRLLGTSIGLHPVVVVLAIMVGGELFGFAGILLAVPATAVLSVFVREALVRYRASRLYREGWAAGNADAH